MKLSRPCYSQPCCFVVGLLLCMMVSKDMASARSRGPTVELTEEVIDTESPTLSAQERSWGIQEAKRLAEEAKAKGHITRAQYHHGGFTAEEKKQIAKEAMARKTANRAAAAAAILDENGNLDYTLGKGGGNFRERNLGAVGIKGAVPSREPRLQILVTSTIEGSAARGQGVALMKGVLRPHDVILGVVSPKVDGLKPDGHFAAEAHKVFARAIEEAEKEENGGKLVLKVWRPKTQYWVKPDPKRPSKYLRIVEPLESTTGDIELNLKVLGSFSETSPWKCAKTEKLIDMAAQSLIDRIFNGKVMASESAAASEEAQEGGATESTASAEEEEEPAVEGDGDEAGAKYPGNVNIYIDMLGLLATGDPKYEPYLKEFTHSKLNSTRGNTWTCAYRLLFFTEYYLATGDKTILPTIEEAADFMAKGVSGVGTWSHAMANVKENGMYGPPSAYGAMNQVSEVAALSLLLTQKCGVKNPYVDKAVELALDFYVQFVDKGSIPYGDHAPIRDERPCINGKQSIAAVLFDVAGRKAEAEFFTRMSVMSHTTREGGHTGHYFAYLWGSLGAARGGPAAAHEFTNSTRYFTELARQPDGSSQYQPMMEGDTLKTGGWSTTGQHLLQYCLPRKALYVTGKGKTVVDPIVGQDLKMLLDAGYYRSNVAKRTDAELVEDLKHYSPLVREWAGQEMAKRTTDFKDQLLAMLDSKDRFTRYGAIQGLRYVGCRSDEVFERLFKIIESDEDYTARFFAVWSLNPSAGRQPNRRAGRGIPVEMFERSLGPPSQAYAERMVKAMVNLKAESYSDKKLLSYMNQILLSVIYEPDEFASFDKDLAKQVVDLMMLHPHGGARTAASELFEHLRPEDLEARWGQIYYGLNHKAPSGVMFGGGFYGKATAVMAKNQIKEGLEMVVENIMKKNAWGNKGRRNSFESFAPYYGQLYLPYIEKYTNKAWLNSYPGFKKGVEIAKNTPAPTNLRSIEKQIKEFEAIIAQQQKASANP